MIIVLFVHNTIRFLAAGSDFIKVLFLNKFYKLNMSLYSGNNLGGAAWNNTQDQQAVLMQQMYANYMTQYVQYLQVNLFFKKWYFVSKIVLTCR